jgi:hypothetical protein
VDLKQRLLDEGWQERFSASGARLNEAVEYYRSLGFEVRVEDIGAVSAGDACTSCFSTPALDGPVKVVFTRGQAEPDGQDEELWS